uniref:DNA primase small subunit n=1 Tax=Romanomermis culicivorax TaxID=13658 RepID=A0A915JQG1_ROMCU
MLGNNAYFQKREFAFILPDDIYLRYRSFNDPLEFERDLIKTAPEKVDIGAVYNYKPKEDRHKKDLTAVERELVFDIDMTDYDDVRTCCKGAGLCRKCWLFMVVAIKIVDAALEEDFGFKERLWIFSGRRGVHCWVSDALARKLSSSARSAIIEYLTVSSAGERSKTVEFKSRTIHHSIKRACRLLDKYFPKMVAQQGWLDNAENVDKMLSLITNAGLKAFIPI